MSLNPSLSDVKAVAFRLGLDSGLKITLSLLFLTDLRKIIQQQKIGFCSGPSGLTGEMMQHDL